MSLRKRMSPYELEVETINVIENARGRKSWRQVHVEAMALWIREYVKDGLPVAPVAAPVVSAVPVVDAAISAVVATGDTVATVVETPPPVLSDLDRAILFCQESIRRNEAKLEEARQKCVTEPSSLTWPNLVRVCPLNIARAQQELAKLEAQKAAENGGEAQMVEEV